jgi:preprotein translocase subunit SecG
MLTVIFVLIFIVCILLTTVVLVQESKGGGLAAGFSSANQLMGVKRTADFLEKATWTLAIVLLGLCLLAAAVQGGRGQAEATQDSELQEFIEGETVLPPAGTQPSQESAPEE